MEDNEKDIEEEFPDLPEDELNKRKINVKIWNSISYVPKSARSSIGGGRLKGMTSIKPQWRYLELTRQFGPYGLGWKYVIEKEWINPGAKGEFVQNVIISLYVKYENDWSEPIPGVGGSKFVAMESGGAHTNDEALKMAVTDALGNAGKFIGLGASVYMGYPDERFSSNTVTSIDDIPKYIRKLQEKAGINDEEFLNKCEQYNWDQDYIVSALESVINKKGVQ